MVGPNTPGERPDLNKSEASNADRDTGGGHKPRFEADIGDQAGDAMHQARQGARDMGRQLKESARSAAERARRQAAGAAEQLRHQGEDVIEQQKGWAAEELEHCAHASRAAAQKLREEDDAAVAKYAEFVADRMDDLAGYVRNRNVGQMINDAGSIARRHPELFFGGMFVLGLLGARFLKATSRPSYDSESDYGYGGSYAYGYETGYGDVGEPFDRSMPVARGSATQPFPPTSQASGTSAGGIGGSGGTQSTSPGISGGAGTSGNAGMRQSTTPGSSVTGPGAGVRPHATQTDKPHEDKNKPSGGTAGGL